MELGTPHPPFLLRWGGCQDPWRSDLSFWMSRDAPLFDPVSGCLAFPAWSFGQVRLTSASVEPDPLLDASFCGVPLFLLAGPSYQPLGAEICPML